MKKILLLFLILSPICNSFGCTCFPPYYSYFFDAIVLHPLFLQNEKNIVKAEIISVSDDSNFMEIHVIENIYNEVKDSTIVISGQDGWNCAVPFNNGSFHVNDTLILFLTPDFRGRIDTLELNDCSLSYLKFSNNNVLGNITHEYSEMNYPEFKSQTQFIISVLELNSVNSQSMLTVYPNPTNGTIRIQCKSGINSEIKIYNSMGQIVNYRRLNSTMDVFSITDLSKGIYFMELISGCNKKTRKIIVN